MSADSQHDIACALDQRTAWIDELRASEIADCDTPVILANFVCDNSEFHSTNRTTAAVSRSSHARRNSDTAHTHSGMHRHPERPV